jgi:hypothetical protein
MEYGVDGEWQERKGDLSGIKLEEVSFGNAAET